jgi:hypothetical protein
MMGHRSLADIYAKEVLSEVEEGAVNVSMACAGRNWHIRVFVSYSIMLLLRISAGEAVLALIYVVDPLTFDV